MIYTNKIKKNILAANSKTSTPLYTVLNNNIDAIKRYFEKSTDLSIKYMEAWDDNYCSIAIVYLSSVIDEKVLIMYSHEINELKNVKADSINYYYNQLKQNLLVKEKLSDITTFEEVFFYLLEGNSIILIEGCDKSLALDTKKIVGRDRAEPTTQSVVRGSREGFTDNIDINLALIRTRLKNKILSVEALNMGTITNTSVYLIYLQGIANDSIINEIRLRLSNIELNGVLDSGYIEELLKDNKYSIFPTILNTERPDTAVGNLLEGRIVIMIEGSPFVLVAPCLFIEFFQVNEDFFQNFYTATLLRIIRYFAFLLTLTIPSLYVALTTYHQEMIPTPLLISIAAQREGVPFPAVVEALFMEITFEILREAGVRMPRIIGPAISIVGALVLGQAVVEAGFVSAAMVIIVSITAISSFVFPYYSMSNAIRIIRFILMICAASFVYMVFLFVCLR